MGMQNGKAELGMTLVSVVGLTEDLDRIDEALDRAEVVLARFSDEEIVTRYKAGDDPVTDVDEALDEALRDVLLRPSEGWLSEETADNPERLEQSRVWIVDPIDGTREFVTRIPEWCVSIALVEDGIPIAGGILAPGSGKRIIGSKGQGVWVNGLPATISPKCDLAGALVLASRSEVKRGEWDAFFRTPLSVRNMGSVALKTALVSTGDTDATFTLTPKNEWDVAAGAALVSAAGGRFSLPDGSAVTFNNADPLLPGFLATGPNIHEQLVDLIAATGT